MPPKVQTLFLIPCGRDDDAVACVGPTIAYFCRLRSVFGFPSPLPAYCSPLFSKNSSNSTASPTAYARSNIMTIWACRFHSVYIPILYIVGIYIYIYIYVGIWSYTLFPRDAMISRGASRARYYNKYSSFFFLPRDSSLFFFPSHFIPQQNICTRPSCWFFFVRAKRTACGRPFFVQMTLPDCELLSRLYFEQKMNEY